jgi:hypothetical protein
MYYLRGEGLGAPLKHSIIQAVTSVGYEKFQRLAGSDNRTSAHLAFGITVMLDYLGRDTW